MDWTIADIPDLSERTVLVTGANTGIGLETAAVLAGAGATVVLACRNTEKAGAAQADIEARVPESRVEVLRLDLASQAQVVDAAAEALERFPRIDVLVSNAGVMSDVRAETVDGFELMFGTNHLGHFAFTARILPAVLAAPASRIVTVVSLSQRFGRIRWDDPHLEHARFREFPAYAQSKLACTLFAFGLQRRLAEAGSTTISLAAHPGFAATDILHGPDPTAFQRFQRRTMGRFIPTALDACRPSVRAATDPDAEGGQLYGPRSMFQTRGAPVLVPASKRSLDVDAQDRLWALSERLTGVTFGVPTS